MAQRTVTVLDEQMCYALLESGIFGRVIFVDDSGPAATPVNYAVLGHDVVFRVEHASHMLAGLELLAHVGQDVAFEVDCIDREQGSAWSVLIRGAARQVGPDAVPELVHELGSKIPRPWAAGVHDVWVRLTPSSVTGRQLGDRLFPLLY